MKRISFEEAKRVELDILLHVAKFCDEHGLRYFLAYGTLIGAVRHKGFIPWDDDIDIQMPREDYEKLIEIYPKENTDEKYFLLTPEMKGAHHPYVKIIDTRTVKKELGAKKNSLLGVDIDVFPLDGQPDDLQAYGKFYDKLYTLYKRYLYSDTALKGLPFKTKIHMLLYRPFALCRKGILKKANKIHSLYPYESSKYVGSVTTIYNGRGNRALKTAFDGYVTLEFEGHLLKAPKGYDEILRTIYGDYMKLPPEEQQHAHHINEMYWKEGTSDGEEA